MSVNFGIHESNETLAFLRILSLLDCHRIKMGTNLENPQAKNLDLIRLLSPKNCSWAEQIVQRLVSKYPKIKTVFCHALSPS